MAGLTATFKKQVIRHTASFFYLLVAEAYSLAAGVVTVVSTSSVLHWLVVCSVGAIINSTVVPVGAYITLLLLASVVLVAHEPEVMLSRPFLRRG